MGYGRIEGGWLVRPPVNGRTVDGRAMSGYRRRVEGDSAFRAQEGWLPVVDDRPDVGEGQRAVRVGWGQSGGQVVAQWEVVDRPPDPERGDHLDPAIGAPDA